MTQISYVITDSYFLKFIKIFFWSKLPLHIVVTKKNITQMPLLFNRRPIYFQKNKSIDQ